MIRFVCGGGMGWSGSCSRPARVRTGHGQGHGDEPLHEIRHQVDLPGRLGAEVHDEVGPSQRQSPDARAGATDIVRSVIPPGRLQRGNDLERPMENTPPGFQLRQQSLALAKVMGSLRNMGFWG